MNHFFAALDLKVMANASKSEGMEYTGWDLLPEGRVAGLLQGGLACCMANGLENMGRV